MASAIKKVHFVILLDDSGSMEGDRWLSALNATKEFLDLCC